MAKDGLQIAKKRREVKGKGEKESYTSLKAEFQRMARRDEKAFLSNQCKDIEKTIEWERLQISSRKLKIPRQHFTQRWAQKGQKWYGKKQKILRRGGKNTQNCTKKIFMTQMITMV